MLLCFPSDDFVPHKAFWFPTRCHVFSQLNFVSHKATFFPTRRLVSLKSNCFSLGYFFSHKMTYFTQINHIIFPHDHLLVFKYGYLLLSHKATNLFCTRLPSCFTQGHQLLFHKANNLFHTSPPTCLT